MAKVLTPRYISYFALLMIAAMMFTGCGSSRKSAVRRGSTATAELPAATPKVARDLVAEARAWLGVPYAWGGSTRQGADCSGFLVSVYRDAAGITLPRTTSEQRDSCIPVNRNQLAVGDILFFSSAKSSDKIAHVGMYVGNGRMIHASSSRGVVEDDLSLKYYIDHYRGAGRVPMLAQALPAEKKKAKKKSRAPAAPVSPSPKDAPEITLDDWLAVSSRPSTADRQPAAAITAPPVPEITLDALLAAGVPPTVHKDERVAASASVELQPDTVAAETAAVIVRNAFGRATK